MTKSNIGKIFNSKTDTQFNFHKFKVYCSQVLEVLKDILKEKDEEEVIPKYDFLKIVNEKYLEHPNSISERITLPYGVKYIDYALYYLMKSKKTKVLMKI